LSLLRRITTGLPVTLYLTADGAAVDANGLGDLPLADAGLKIGKNLVSLDLG